MQSGGENSTVGERAFLKLIPGLVDPFLGAVGNKVEVTVSSGESKTQSGVERKKEWKVTRRGEPGTPSGMSPTVKRYFSMMKKMTVGDGNSKYQTFVNRGILVGEIYRARSEIVTQQQTFLFINDEGHLVILYKVLLNGTGWVSETIAQRD